MNDSTRPIFPTCSICNKTIEEIGGRKLTNTRKHVSPEQCQHIDDIIARGFTPWFCQKCVGMVCQRCGEPYTNPMSYSVFNNDGTISHCAILPYTPSCINPRCSNCEKDPKRLEKLRKKYECISLE